ncbi:oxygenase MpaB family protein [Novosphingobium sp. PASSN1]|uniref:oxygenase MpaB family protein n=1 Tax=Novosphingobium sp. PASSN1 TaxID=2015561 RepID=UPI0025D6F3B3|nr:oxygenase MpaB family protein [Novosphingobium sp. PASSN1]
MATPIAELRARIAAQRTDNPAMYGAVDFSVQPERLLLDGDIAGSELRGHPKVAAKLLENRELMERIGAYTMMGDALADPYAALMPEHGFKRLVDMLVEACDKGVEAVEGAPAELVTFIRSMEATPAWVDMQMVEEGARLQRVSFANVAPWAIRGAFIATFMNKYAALPMALTGTLSNKTAARRIKETATFFGTSLLPGALARFGAGFKAAAMVRLMHSMVRFNVLSNSQGNRMRWDQRIYGIPIPQVDQMPAGLISDFLISSKVLKDGREDFTPEERAQIELSRYRCFLLGLPEDLLAQTPRGIVDAWNARALSLRAGFDEATCGGLLRATMEADLVDATTPQGKVRDRLERSFAKVYFMQNFCDGSEKAAARFGVKIRAIDKLRAAAVGVGLMGQMRFYGVAAKTPVVRHFADQRLVGKVRGYLGSLGHAEFTTDAAKYKPAAAIKPAA